MELYIQDLTLFTINRGHRDTWESRDGNNKEEENFLPAATPGHGEAFVYGLFYAFIHFLVSVAITKPSRQHLATVIVPFLKLLHNIWLSLIYLFIHSFSAVSLLHTWFFCCRRPISP